MATKFEGKAWVAGLKKDRFFYGFPKGRGVADPATDVQDPNHTHIAWID